MSTLYRAKCGQCGAIYGYQGRSLEFVRMQCCGACRVRMVVIGHEERAEPPAELPAVTKAPGIEHCVISERTIGIARGLVLSALGE